MINIVAVNESQHKITSIAALKKIFSEGWPFMLSRLFFIGNNFCTTLILIRYNPDLLPGTPLITSGQLFLMSTAIAVLYSIAIRAGINMGAKNHTQVSVVFQAGIFQALILSIFVICISFIVKPLYTLFGQNESLSLLAQQYFTCAALGVLPHLIVNSLQQVLVGLGRVKIVLGSTILNSLVFAVSGYLLTNYSLGTNVHGIEGIAYAFNITNWLNLALLLAYFKLPKNGLSQFEIFRKNNLKCIKQEMKKLFQMGIPIGLQILSELATVIGVVIYSGLLGRLSENQITDLYLSIVVVSSFALAQTVGTLIGREVGAKHYMNAAVYGKVSIILSFCIGITVAFFFVVARNPLVELFTKDAAILGFAAYLFIVNGVGEIADNVRNITTGALRGYRDVKWPALANVFSMTMLALPLGYYLGFYLNLGLIGVYIGRALGMIAGATIIFILYLNRLKQYKEQTKPIRSDLLLLPNIDVINSPGII